MQPPLLAPSPMLPLKAVGAGRPSHLHPRPPPSLYQERQSIIVAPGGYASSVRV